MLDYNVKPYILKIVNAHAIIHVQGQYADKPYILCECYMMEYGNDC